MARPSDVATKFMLRAVQNWGQGEGDRIAATQAVLDAAGFDAKATCGPVFGAIWRDPCAGPDGAAATAWLKQLTETMPCGEFYTECEHVDAAIAARTDTAA